MRKQLYLILLIGMMATTLSACGKSNPEQEIKRIEAGNAAESKELTERKYEDTSKEPVTTPDRNSGSTSAEEDIPEDSIGTIDMDPIIYGTWIAEDGSNLAIFNSKQGVKFNLYDASIDDYVYGDATTDNSTYIEVTYQVQVDMPEDADPETYVEPEPTFKTIKYTIDKNEFNKEESIMSLTLTGSGKTTEFTMAVYDGMIDYSQEDNDLSEGIVVIEEGGVNSEILQEKAEFEKQQEEIEAQQMQEQTEEQEQIEE